MSVELQSHFMFRRKLQCAFHLEVTGYKVTLLQLLLTYTSVGRWIVEGYIVPVIMLTFLKAFDVVCYAKLLFSL